MNCEHQEFSAKVHIRRVEDIGSFVADVGVVCVQCGKPFQFLGVTEGTDFNRPTTDRLGIEGHFPIRPFEGLAGMRPPADAVIAMTEKSQVSYGIPSKLTLVLNDDGTLQE